MRGLATLVGLVVALPLLMPGGTEAFLIEVNKLTASDAETNDSFGHSVALDGDTAIVGAIGEDAGQPFSGMGAAYVFGRDEGGTANWGEVIKLTASDAEKFDDFGRSAALDGDVAIVGANREDAGGDRAGAAYVFERDQGGTDNWGEVKKLVASDAEADDELGYSVAVSGDTAVVGARREDAGGISAGAAYVFRRDQGGADNWGEVKKLVASDAEIGDRFGFTVAASGDTAVVGATFGFAAYVFQRDEGGADNWGEVKKLTASDSLGGNFFGFVALSGDTVVVGAIGENSAGPFTGAAYVFERDEGGTDNWGEVKKLTASDAQADDLFGRSVAVSGNTVVVGTSREDTRGSAFVFGRDEGGADNWGEVKELLASDAQAGDNFSWRLGLSGSTALAGADGDNAGTGAAYVFEELSVGGVAELPDVAAAPLESGRSSGPSADVVSGIVAAVAAGLLVLGGTAWYAKRRWSR